MSDTRHYKEAIITFTEALKFKPNDVKSIIGRGLTYNELKLYEQALADFTEVLKLKPNDAEVILYRGQTYSHMNQYWEALKDFNLVIGLDPAFEHQGHEEKGLVLHTLQRYQEAITAFTQALKIEPTCSECWMGLAKTYEASFSRSQLPKLLQSVPISTTDKAFVIAVRAEVMSSLGYYQEALTDLDNALILDETLIFEHTISRGLLLSYLERYEEAIESYKQYFKCSSHYFRCLYNIAVAMTCWKGELEAKLYIDAALEALIAKVPTIQCGPALYGLGGLAALRGEKTQALDYLKGALSLEKECISWAQHDIAWHDLQSDTQFLNLILSRQQGEGNLLAFDLFEREDQLWGMNNDTYAPGSVHAPISLESQTLHTLKVFLCYSPDDRLVVQELYHRLQADGIDPWLDEENLLPGQDKEVEI